MKYTIKDICKQMGVTPAAVRYWIAQGKLRAHREERRIIKRSVWTVTEAEMERFRREEKFYGKHEK